MLFDEIGLLYNYYNDNDSISFRDKTSNKRIFEIKISHENDNIIAISHVKKFTEELVFTIPIFALCLLIFTIKYNFKYMTLTVKPEEGIDYCLLCYYQKFGFQPFKNTYHDKSFLKAFNEIIEEVIKLEREDKNDICYDKSNLDYDPSNIESSIMYVDRNTLLQNVYNMIKNNDICTKYLIY